MVYNFRAVWKRAILKRPYPGFPPGTHCARVPILTSTYNLGCISLYMYVTIAH